MIGIGVILCFVLHIATLLFSTSSGNPYYAHDFRAPLRGQGDRSLKTYTEALAVCRERGAPMATMHTPELHRMAVNQVSSQLENFHYYYVDLLWSNSHQRYYWGNLDDYVPNRGYINGFYFEVPSISRGCVGFVKYPRNVALRPITCDRKADVLCLIPNPNKVTTSTTTTTTTTTATTNLIANTALPETIEKSSTNVEFSTAVPREESAEAKALAPVVIIPIGVGLVLITSMLLFMMKRSRRKKNEKDVDYETYYKDYKDYNYYAGSENNYSEPL